jgi:hypothetical protein
MKYLEWNNHIAKHFFNPDQAGKDIHLFITKQEIINLARETFNTETDKEIWDDFVRKLKTGLPGSSAFPNIFDKAFHSFQQWKRLKSIDGVELKHPPYISYLVFSVLPLIEIQGDYNANNYYDRLNDFLIENDINQNLRNQLSTIDILWTDLGNWANTIHNGEQGFFRLRNFTHQNWIYVGKVFSQCVFPPRAIKRLPNLFLQAGMIPDTTYQPAEIKRYLLQYGSSILLLSKNILDIIRKSETNELGQSIIDTVRKEYGKWTGESHTVDDTGTRSKRSDISSRIYLQLQLFTNEGRIEFSFRMKSANEFPEDLNFNGNEIIEEKAGYSKTINLPFKESFQLKDDFNRWVAKFPEKDVRLFISGASLQFSTDYWIETDNLSKVNWTYLLCRNAIRDQISNWGKNQCSKFVDESDYANMPQGYSLFKFLNPRVGIDGIPELTMFREKSIRLASALEVDFRTYTNDIQPEVEIVNSDGTERVYIQYKNSEEKTFLKKKDLVSNYWLIPEDISLYTDFNVRVDGEQFIGNETTFKIISTDNSAMLLTETKLPKRDSFGRISTNDANKYVRGSNIFGVDLLKQASYKHLFRGINEELNYKALNPTYIHRDGNILLSFLTLKGTVTAQEFHAAFDLAYSKYSTSNSQNNNFNYSKIKKTSLNFFDYLGYLDYEYETNSIVVNPPQFVFIPSDKGRRVLLIGGRDGTLVNRMIETAPAYNLRAEITKQLKSSEDLLLPDAIMVKAFGTPNGNYGENNLNEFAADLNIRFNPEDLVQVGLQQFGSDIMEYEKDLIANKETQLTYEDWPRYIFNLDTLEFDRSTTESFDKNLSLLEYRLRPWEYHHRIWINQKCYLIDRNWGKYYMLKKLNRNVILKGNNKVAIPTRLPLPRLLFESIMLCSGIAPEIRYIQGKAFRVFDNIPSMFIVNLFNKLGQTAITFNSL